uniref:Uncharacterized protein n=1 Tax=Hemiselmis andersenii TaxID=464988 RepID=A0A7S1DWZ0_HEMAN|mmetsp:Transcript_27657/g.67417  ORF Transcript_27657/g.67417 Transcript_27657/m.67417 type:complete len:137 (+) Transcript_27657:242-652(+)
MCGVGSNRTGEASKCREKCASKRIASVGGTVTSDPNAKKGVAKPSPKLNSAWRTGSSPSARGRGDLRDSASPSFAGSLNDPPFLLAMRIGELEPSSSHPPLLVFSLELASSPPFSPRAQLIQLDIPTPFVLFQLSG